MNAPLSERDAIERLRAIVAQLRDPAGGCPWDLRQTHATMTRYLIEEAYEVVEAIEAGDDDAIREELGDLLFQVVFHAQLARERGAWDLDDVINGIADKMIARHPHVFGEDRGETDPEEVRQAWERHKRSAGRRVLDGVPRAMPALQRAQRLTAKAATVGFDWERAERVLLKVDEELDELKEAVAGGDLDAIEDELGDLLFVLTNLARKLDLQAERALRRTLGKFERRFNHIEDRLIAQGGSPAEASLEEMDALWEEAKALERGESPEAPRDPDDHLA
ncbi:MAG: nucleoside triphosphate pyrophosphohydrolase [Myxococcales bacterium]|nr:nucleoside triphosphate pyrophosphohydrolase [Myxococcales bacterium]